jgi:hypothetical protein
MYCFGAQANGAAIHSHPATKSFGPNVNAADPNEDVSPGGVRAYGQSETSVAASGRYAVEAWNDSTAFFSTCGAPQNKDQATGFGFSANSGASYTDLGGLPNADCNNTVYGGDPSVETWTTGGKTYFYVSSLFNCNSAAGCTADPRSHIAMTEFGFDANFNSTNIIELAVCDIGNGALGGTPAAPVCTNGGLGSALAPAAPYMVVANTDPAGCENEGAYPAVDPATGDVYVAYEHNWPCGDKRC